MVDSALSVRGILGRLCIRLTSQANRPPAGGNEVPPTGRPVEREVGRHAFDLQMPIYTSRLVDLSFQPVTSKEITANAGNRTTERTVGAPTVADAMIAAAQRMPFAIRYFRFMVISCHGGGEL